MYANKRLSFALLACGSLGLSALGGCTLEKKDDAGEFRDAIPQKEAVALSGPDSSSSTSTESAGPSLRTQGTAPSTPYARWYGFTREMRQGVNAVTASVLGGAWLIIHTRPTSIDADSATW